MSVLNNTKKEGIYNCLYCEGVGDMNRQQYLKHNKSESHKNTKKFLIKNNNGKVLIKNVDKQLSFYTKKARKEIKENMKFSNILKSDFNGSAICMNMGYKTLSLTTHSKYKEPKIFNRYFRVIRKMKRLVRKHEFLNVYVDNKKVLLNLSHRGGWGEELYDNEEEMNRCLIELIYQDYKRVGSIVSQDGSLEYFDKYIIICKNLNLNYRVLKTLWGMFVMFIFKDNVISESELIELNDETMDFDKMGYYYGYNDIENIENI
jgi:hypothetical protein